MRNAGTFALHRKLAIYYGNWSVEPVNKFIRNSSGKTRWFKRNGANSQTWRKPSKFPVFCVQQWIRWYGQVACSHVDEAQGYQGRSWLLTCTMYKNAMIHWDYSQQPYRCEYCGKAFATTKSVCVHLQLHHYGRDAKYLCLPCKTYFRRSNQLFDHNATVHKKTYQCRQCCKCFHQLSEQTLHERLHSFNKSFRCERCTETFQSPSSLSLHFQRVHLFSVDRSIHCPLCDYSFAKQSDLNAHIYVHNDAGQDPFECPDCSELFDNLELFVEHMGVHERKVETTNDQTKISVDNLDDTDDIDDADDFLDAVAMDDIFDDPSDDNESNLTKMGVTLSYTCPICNKIYEDITAFNSHCEKHETLASPTKLAPKTTEMLKPNRPKTTRAAVSLKWQENDNKIRNFSCEKCNRKFTMASTLSLHLRRTHLGIKPYKCQVCQWAFAQSSDLIKHMRKHTGM